MQVPMTPGRILKRAVKLYPDKTAVVDGDIRWSYSEVQNRVNQVVNALRGLNISDGARVAVLDYNTYRYMELYFGAALSGHVLSPLNIRLAAEEYAYILNNAENEVVIFHADFITVLDQARPRLNKVKNFFIADGPCDEEWITGTYEDLVSGAPADPDHHEPDDENNMLNLYYTSGTTGNPKGVMLTHRNIYANALSTIIAFKLDDATVWHHIAPLFHLADAFFIWSVTYQGGCHVMQRLFDPKPVLQTIQNEHITAAMMVPTMINFLLAVPGIDGYDLSSLQWVMVGGAPMSPANAQRMMEKLGCRYISGYGLTETTPLLTVGNLKDTLADSEDADKMNYLTRTGLEVPGVDLRVVDQNGADVPRDGSTIGEIIVRGDNVMKGYWKLPAETEQAIKDGYFYTGDLATVDAEGYILIVDRAKDIIISGGENIASVEVENVLYQHPDVLECAVIAVPDEQWGEVPMAMVALRQNAEAGEQDLIDFCRQKLARFKVPKTVKFMTELPKTGSGKILKIKLRKQYAAPGD
ncbi:MAG: long-chain-fatty-acid--CoA ligase [Desulfobacteraceae bacterium]|nr:long-chain-fatty-acid--CoA ligase [Desulfobacteraceae bacterium]